MKRYIPFLFFVSIIVCLFFVSCSDNSGLIDMKSLRLDDQQAINTFGYVNSVYGSGSSRTIIEGYEGYECLTKDGPFDLIFDTYLVVYDELKPTYVTYVETVAPEISAFQIGHYQDLQPQAGKTYVEYSSWRFRDSGEICFIDVRVAEGDFYTKQTQSSTMNSWAKSIIFDPYLKYDLSRGFDVETLEPLQSYNPLTGEVIYGENDYTRIKPTVPTIEYYDSDIITPVLKTITPSMTVYFEQSNEGKPAILYKSDDYTVINGVGVCDKTAISSSTIDDFINGREPNCLFQVGHNNINLNYDEQYMFELNCIVNVEGSIRYEVKLLVDETALNDGKYYAIDNIYESVEEIDAAFNKL